MKCSKYPSFIWIWKCLIWECRHAFQGILILSQTWWRHQMETFSALLALCVWGIHRSPVNSPHKGQWRGALMFPLIWTWINSSVNNHEAGDLRRHRAHYDIIVMNSAAKSNPCCQRLIVTHQRTSITSTILTKIDGKTYLFLHKHFLLIYVFMMVQMYTIFFIWYPFSTAKIMQVGAAQLHPALLFILNTTTSATICYSSYYNELCKMLWMTYHLLLSLHVIDTLSPEYWLQLTRQDVLQCKNVWQYFPETSVEINGRENTAISWPPRESRCKFRCNVRLMHRKYIISTNEELIELSP